MERIGLGDATQVRGKHSVKMGRDCFKTNHGVPLVPLVPLQFQALKRHFSHYNDNISGKIFGKIYSGIYLIFEDTAKHHSVGCIMLYVCNIYIHTYIYIHA